MNFTQDQYLANEARRRHEQLIKRGVLDAGTTEQSALAEAEFDLHDQIEAECRRRGWLAIHSRRDKPATNNVGTVDFIIAADNGRTIWIEAKSDKGKPSEAQRNMHAWLHKLGHECFVCRSFEEFLAAVTPMPTRKVSDNEIFAPTNSLKRQPEPLPKGTFLD